MNQPMNHETFIAETIAWINRTMVPPGVTISADTPLFANGLINSIRVLRLIAWTEHALGIRIPDARIRMDYFRTVRHIADAFAAASAVDGGDNAAA